MLSITPEDIANLSDGDLRELVGLLCEAVMRAQGHPTSAVTFGGNQDATDGGIDVRVLLKPKSKMKGFVPKPNTGFQVKKTDFIPSKISKEMRPKGRLRPSIRTLAKKGGAYIIVSSAASLSETAHTKRISAMESALKGEKAAKGLTLEFYDRNQLATWLRDHAGLIPWVRSRAGREVQGWQSYGAWAYPAEGTAAEYLLDEKIRIRTEKSEDGAGLSVAEGLQRIRQALREPRNVVRLVGLSGVGKTRLLQALFDSRVGTDSLDPSRVFYTNMSDNPDPQPIGLASDLIASKTPAIIVVDNCPADLHRRLTEICRQVGSLVSVATVEYDIRDDEPEETAVFRIEPSSEKLIEMLIRKRFEQVSAVDAQTIAQFSGGNARIAVALAGTVGKSDKLTGLGEEDLFKRLFQQRHEHDADLLQIAQACSLVYSFEGEKTHGEDAELPVIAALIGKTVLGVHAAVAELERRDLVQRRNVWRAVLPHAIANRLAKLALQNIPPSSIKTILIENASARLLKSFSRRLGYLHDSKESQKTVDNWFAPGQLLGDLSNLSELGHGLLSNVAPVAPASVLAALGRGLPTTRSGRDKIARLLRSIAYEAVYFEDCIELLAKLAEADANATEKGEAASCLKSLFFLYLSGTQASQDQRAMAVRHLLESKAPIREALGLAALDAALEAYHFSSSYNFDFGSHSRDFGWQPKTGKEVMNWYRSFLKLLDAVRLGSPWVADRLKRTLASNFRALYGHGGVGPELDGLFRKIAAEGFWRDGWVAIRQTLGFDGKKMPADVRKRIEALERVLHPKQLIENVRAIVLGNTNSALDLDDIDLAVDDDPTAAHNRQEAIARALGKQVAVSSDELRVLRPELVRGHGRLWSFGIGMAEGAVDKKETWNGLVRELSAAPPPERRIQVLGGYLRGLHEIKSSVLDELLDEALVDPVLGQDFPSIQASIPLGKRAIARLRKSLDLGLTSRGAFHALGTGRSTDGIPPAELRDLLLEISIKAPHGFDAALEILFMRVWSDRQQKRPVAPEFSEAGRALLQHIEFKDLTDRHDHRMAELVSVSFRGADGKSEFDAICTKFRAAVANDEVYAFKHDDFIAALFAARPSDALDAFLGGDAENQALGAKILAEELRHRAHPLASVSVSELVQWCDRDPTTRYPIAASVIELFPGDGLSSEWSEVAREIMNRAPDKMAVLKRYVARFHPMMWSGSVATILESRLPLLRELQDDPDQAISDFAGDQYTRLVENIARERKWETEHDRDTDERFED